MCCSILPITLAQSQPPTDCPAKALVAEQRIDLAVQGLAGWTPITELAAQSEVSRKFVYQQMTLAEEVLGDAFAPQPPDEQVLFQLPVTKHWLRQLTLGLVLICHSPLRGVVELLRDLFDYHISLGSVFDIVHAAVTPAQERNHAQDLSHVRVGAHDEIFQANQPVLVGVDPLSTYCYMVSPVEQRDADTWGVHLLDLQARGFAPDFVVADAGSALRAAQAEVLPGVACRSDVFHALYEVSAVVTKLENRAYAILATCAELERKLERDRHRGRPLDRACRQRLSEANKEQAQASALADAVALLARWLHYDVLDLAGPTHADRLALYDFILGELKDRVPQAPGLLGPLVTYLKGQRDDLLAFAAQLDRDFLTLAAEFAVAPELVRQLFAVQTLELDSPKRWYRDAPLRRLLGDRYFPLSQALDALRQGVVRASSLVENLNSRLRSYFFLRRHLGNDYLALLQFFLNHRRYLRSEHPDRVHKSPAELLTGQRHPHWLELLGYTRFSRN